MTNAGCTLKRYVPYKTGIASARSDRVVTKQIYTNTIATSIRQVRVLGDKFVLSLRLVSYYNSKRQRGTSKIEDISLLTYFINTVKKQPCLWNYKLKYCHKTDAYAYTIRPLHQNLKTRVKKHDFQGNQSQVAIINGNFQGPNYKVL